MKYIPKHKSEVYLKFMNVMPFWMDFSFREGSYWLDTNDGKAFDGQSIEEVLDEAISESGWNSNKI